MADIKDRTVTSIFIVPTLKIGETQLKDNNFINGYIRDLRKDDNYDDVAYLLFKPKNLEKFKDFVDEEYERTPDIIEDYDYDNFVVLVYTLDPYFIKDFNLIKQGKYSKTSQEFQELFPKIKRIILQGKYKDEISLQHQVFNKSDDYVKNYWEERTGISFKKDMEYWKGFDLDQETLDIEKIKQLV